MDITFISMHDLSEEARLVYASDSISDVLGYEPQEVVGSSLFTYFHPEEIPFAQMFHGRRVNRDKAAVLAYCRLKSKTGEYICCECVFTVVYSVVVAATSVYRQTNKSHERALNAPYIRRAFSSSQLDPRYHMLAHLSPKFSTPQAGQHEPRACLILNRFTRTLTILYATNILRDILNFSPDEAVGLSFFEFISPDCLQDAVEALERAKENDSIAYLRFYARDPRAMVTPNRSSSGASIHHRRRRRPSSSRRRSYGNTTDGRPRDPDSGHGGQSGEDTNDDDDSVMTSEEDDDEDDVGDDDDDDNVEADENGNYYARASSQSSSATSLSNSALMPARGPEVEAVVSCTSDGLVVVLRRARPMIPVSGARATATDSGFFASPWARGPFNPPVNLMSPASPGGPAPGDFMDSIRQVAVFAWCLRSINENMVQFARFKSKRTEESALTPPRKMENPDEADGSYTDSDRAINTGLHDEIRRALGPTYVSSTALPPNSTDRSNRAVGNVPLAASVPPIAAASSVLPPHPKTQTATHKRKRSD